MGSTSKSENVIMRGNKKLIIVGSDSESDNTPNDLDLSSNELPDANREALVRKRYGKRKRIPQTSISSSRTHNSDDCMDHHENGSSTTNELLKELLQVNMENQKLLHKFVAQQQVLIDLAKQMTEQINRYELENAKSEDESASDSDDHESNLINKDLHVSLMQERIPSKLITKAAYALWGENELARRSVRFQKNVAERPLSPDKKRAVKKVFTDWMKKNHWPRDTIEEELTRTKMNKYFNGAISAARKKVNYKLKAP